MLLNNNNDNNEYVVIFYFEQKRLLLKTWTNLNIVQIKYFFEFSIFVQFVVRLFCLYQHFSLDIVI